MTKIRGFIGSILFREVVNIIVVKLHYNQGGKIIEILRKLVKKLHVISPIWNADKTNRILILGTIRL